MDQVFLLSLEPQPAHQGRGYYFLHMRFECMHLQGDVQSLALQVLIRKCNLTLTKEMHMNNI